MTSPSGAAIHVHAAIARALVDNGASTLFGLIGDANLYVVDSFVREFGGQYVSAANEAGAAVMALGFAVVSGKVGVATVTHGPAVTNTLTALVEGVKGQIPMVLMCGDTPIEDRDGLQNAPQRELIVATGAGFEQLRSPETLSQDISTAFRRARMERRPIALNMPVNFQWQEVTYKPPATWIQDPPGPPAAGEAFDHAVGIIAAARRPVVLAGRGATDPPARAAILKLAERIGAPVATTLRAKGLFSGEFCDLGVFGTLSTPPAAEAILQADCIIALGASLNRFTAAHGTFLAGKRVIHCNADAAEIGRTFAPDVGLVAAPAAAAEALTAALDLADIPGSGFRDAGLDARLRSYSPMDGLEDLSTSSTIDVRRAIHRLGAALPPRRIVVSDGGRFLGVPWQVLNVPDPRSFVYTINFGSIGLGMAYAIGASFAAPGCPVLMVCGDGGFMLGGLSEFNTAVRHAVDLTVAVCNDSSYGAEHIQFRNKNMDPGLSVFDWPDLAPVAEALGGEGVTVRTARDLEAAAAAIANRSRPLLIDLKLDPDHVPSILR